MRQFLQGEGIQLNDFQEQSMFKFVDSIVGIKPCTFLNPADFDNKACQTTGCCGVTDQIKN